MPRALLTCGLEPLTEDSATPASTTQLAVCRPHPLRRPECPWSPARPRAVSCAGPGPPARTHLLTRSRSRIRAGALLPAAASRACALVPSGAQARPLYSLIRSFVHSFIRSCVRSLTRALTGPRLLALVRAAAPDPRVHSLPQAFINSGASERSFIYFIRSPGRSALIHSFPRPGPRCTVVGAPSACGTLTSCASGGAVSSAPRAGGRPGWPWARAL